MVFLQTGSRHSDFPFYPLPVVIFKEFFAASGTSLVFAKSGEWAQFLSPSRRGGAAEAGTGLCRVSQARATLRTGAKAMSRITCLVTWPSTRGTWEALVDEAWEKVVLGRAGLRRRMQLQGWTH